MRRSLPLVGLLGLALVGCRSSDAPAPNVVTSAPKTVTIAAGTPVKLILLDELTSGGTPEGSTVRLALAEPIDGLPAMSPVSATVTWSRTEGTLGGLTNRPARLNLKLESLKGPGGEEIALSADAKEPKGYELNRGDTGRPEAGDPGDEDEPAQKAVQELIKKGSTEGLDAKEVGDLARRLGLSETAKLAEANRLDEVKGLIQQVRGGGSVANLASGTPIAAALELVNLAGDVGQKLGRRLGGRNIRAYPGTIVPAYVAKETTVTLR